MIDSLFWAAAALMLLGLALASAEVFVPSGGMIGFLSLVAVIAAISLAFYRGPVYGVSFLTVAVVAVPAVLATALHFWPETRLGRRVLLDVPTSDEVLPDSDLRRELKSLVGRVGEAKSLMLPGGVVLIDGRNVDALSEGMAIEKGAWVKVVEVRGTRVVVRPTSERPRPRDAEDPLSQPIDELGLNPFDDPLA
ncbi:MAG TPA: NfeD family protein [Pirellulales bacterium]|nr:NfeD family protein [Pirellulales bacterium]